MLAAWDLRDTVLASIHIINESGIPDSALNFYLGPGLYTGITREKGHSRFRFGLSIQPGLNFYTRRFEVFLQTTPRFDLLPDPKLALGGSVGLRYYP